MPWLRHGQCGGQCYRQCHDVSHGVVLSTVHGIVHGTVHDEMCYVVLVREFEFRRGEILNIFAKLKGLTPESA